MQHTEWDELHIDQLIALDRIAPGHWSTRHGDVNPNGRSYGGQLLGQAMMAALLEVPADRLPTMMQFLFVQGAAPDQPLELMVTTLQEGKRFSARHVRATQGASRVILDAQVTCSVPIPSPSHANPSGAPREESPEALPTLDDLDPQLLAPLGGLGGYSHSRKPSMDFRIPEARRQLDPSSMGGQFRFWMRAARPLPADPRTQAAAFAYLSDWWLNFASLGLHLRGLAGRQLYISSLNHAIWLHGEVQPDRWYHVNCTSPCSGAGRGLVVAAIHDLNGRQVASATQECLISYAD